MSKLEELERRKQKWLASTSFSVVPPRDIIDDAIAALRESEQDNARLRAAIEAAPCADGSRHDPRICPYDSCDCWKRQALKGGEET